MFHFTSLEIMFYFLAHSCEPLCSKEELVFADSGSFSSLTNWQEDLQSRISQVVTKQHIFWLEKCVRLALLFNQTCVLLFWLAGDAIAQLTDVGSAVLPQSDGRVTVFSDRTGMVKAARLLLSSVTKVLVLADRIVIKQIITSRNKVSHADLGVHDLQGYALSLLYTTTQFDTHYRLSPLISQR